MAYQKLSKYMILSFGGVTKKSQVHKCNKVVLFETELIFRKSIRRVKMPFVRQMDSFFDEGAKGRKVGAAAKLNLKINEASVGLLN